MVKVLLINPKDEYIEKDGGKIGDRPPLGLLSISAYLKKSGHEVIIKDLNHCDLLDIFEDLWNYACISVSTPNYKQCLDIANKINYKNKDIIVIAGGNHVTDFPNQKETLETFNWIVQGDGEQAVLDIIEGRISEEEKKSKIIKRELENVDIIPDYGAVDMSEYTMLVDGLPGAIVVTARGCKYNCCYCGSAKIKKLRERSIKSVFDEIDLLYKKYGRKGFYFGDDIFTYNKNRTLDLCSIIALDYNDIKFRCTTRADLLDKDILEFLKMAHCTIISLGIESGSDTVLKAMHKGMTVEQQRKAIQLCKEYGIKVKSFYIFPLPGDNEETVKETKQFIKENPTEYCDIYLLCPYPSTPLWDNPERFGMGIYKPQSPEEWDLFNQIQEEKVHFKHPNFTSERIIEIIKELRALIKEPGITY